MDASVAQAEVLENPKIMVVKDNGAGWISQGDKSVLLTQGRSAVRVSGKNFFARRVELPEPGPGSNSLWLRP